MVVVGEGKGEPDKIRQRRSIQSTGFLLKTLKRIPKVVFGLGAS
jgi:hypothetical protein